jgi:hypothetical protein
MIVQVCALRHFEQECELLRRRFALQLEKHGRTAFRHQSSASGSSLRVHYGRSATQKKPTADD